ncbi:DEAD/DEAH box helicase [[Mycoplasma] mobile]|uniref:DEAD-box ATP-dependent RNA helicase n=1 Tax=Mycoplasma mobile (strain ATCC 43663 / 163K / NCTC 11711) TaxID=267748 RepID=Q6KI10_MYCM1|nr:DEAD/DEAH box helicase [[Mycoplasma] mobile]AAT27766.1 DEAD-box ATP-dependent RNA helicase [Mycoplasma mobile 163K]
MKFQELDIDDKIINNLKKIGFEAPTQIQELVISTANKNQNILGCAQTGTGKTAAFGVSIINKILKNKKNNAKSSLTTLILVPTRELSVQVNENIKLFSSNLPITSLAIYGGMRNRESHFSIFKRGLDIIVATPGRLLDYIKSGKLSLSQVDTVVLDEADLMVDMGFIDDVKEILKRTKEEKQVMLFSATMPKAIMNLVEDFMGKFELIQTESFAKPLQNIEHLAYFYTSSKPVELLQQMLKEEKIYSAIVFVKTKRDADNVENLLSKMKLKIDSLHGDKTQASRSRILRSFKEGKIQILVATDVASRGIDIDDISHVFNLNIPEDPEIYTHRVGRTGRASKVGKAISFFSKRDFFLLAKVEKEIKMEIPKKQIQIIEDVIEISDFTLNIHNKSERSSDRRSDRSSYRRDSRSSFSSSSDRSRRPENKSGNFRRERSFNSERNFDSSKNEKPIRSERSSSDSPRRERSFSSERNFDSSKNEKSIRSERSSSDSSRRERSFSSERNFDSSKNEKPIRPERPSGEFKRTRAFSTNADGQFKPSFKEKKSSRPTFRKKNLD